MEALVVSREAQFIGLEADGKMFRGIPRGKVLKKTKIFAGDFVKGQPIDEKNFMIDEVLERKNLLIKPTVANVDRVLVVMSIRLPDFDNLLLDKLLCVYDFMGVEPVVVITKLDLLEDKNEFKKWEKIYSDAGYSVVGVSLESGEGIKELKKLLEGFICVTAGPSGVGKSSLVSKLTGVKLKTQDVSRKTKKGRHTTKGVHLFKFAKDSFIGDTPGFSRVEPLAFMDKRDVAKCFREFQRYSCRFPDCTHTKEPGCAVKEALERGEISPQRYSSYRKIIGA